MQDFSTLLLGPSAEFHRWSDGPKQLQYVKESIILSPVIMDLAALRAVALRAPVFKLA
jgi:hypothetical protein